MTGPAREAPVEVCEQVGILNEQNGLDKDYLRSLLGPEASTAPTAALVAELVAHCRRRDEAASQAATATAALMEVRFVGVLVVFI